MKTLSTATVHIKQLGEIGWLEVRFYFTPAERPVLTGRFEDALPGSPAEADIQEVYALDTSLNLLPVLSAEALEWTEKQILKEAP